MAAAASLAFRSVRKQSISASSSPAFDPASISTANLPLSPSPLPGMNASHISSAATGSSDGGIGSSLIGPGGAALMAGAPAAANTIANKQAVAGSSLYQACLNLRDRLYSVPASVKRISTSSLPPRLPHPTAAQPHPQERPYPKQAAIPSPSSGSVSVSVRLSALSSTP